MKISLQTSIKVEFSKEDLLDLIRKRVSDEMALPTDAVVSDIRLQENGVFMVSIEANTTTTAPIVSIASPAAATPSKRGRKKTEKLEPEKAMEKLKESSKEVIQEKSQEKEEEETPAAAEESSESSPEVVPAVQPVTQAETQVPAELTNDDLGLQDATVPVEPVKEEKEVTPPPPAETTPTTPARTKSVATDLFSNFHRIKN